MWGYLWPMTKDHYKHERLKELREAAGLTQEQLAARLDTHWGTISRVENGKSCSFFLLVKLADIFNVSWQSLLRIEDNGSENISSQHNISCCIP